MSWSELGWCKVDWSRLHLAATKIPNLHGTGQETSYFSTWRVTKHEFVGEMNITLPVRNNFSHTASFDKAEKGDLRNYSWLRLSCLRNWWIILLVRDEIRIVINRSLDTAESFKETTTRVNMHVDSIHESKWRAGYNITNDWALFSLINPLGRRRSIKLAPLDQYTIKLLLGSKFQNL